jgi:DNA polymerase III delta prime subunit
MNLKYVSPAPSCLKSIVKDYKEFYSPHVLICGKPRVSKTTKGFIIANWLSGLLFKETWDWKENTIVNIDQLINEMGSSEEGRIYLMDEVERQLSRKNWQKPESQLFSLLMESQARKHFIMILILPKAWALGSDHATDINYVIPVHSRTFCYPYKVNTNIWDISLKKKLPQKIPLAWFHIDVKDQRFKLAFKEELKDLEPFKKFIEVNLKDSIMDEAYEKRNLYNPHKEMTSDNLPERIKKIRAYVSPSL